jgi:PKHD-type hydroxylase
MLGAAMMLQLDDVLTKAEVARVRETLERAPFESGTVSGKKALKNNLQADKSNPEVQVATRAVLNRMFGRPEFTGFAMPKNCLLMFNRYDVGMTYKDHMDAALMGPSQSQALRADLSFTVFLTEPEEYEGGEFVLQSPFGEQRIKQPAGSFMCYPSDMLHRVDPVTAGTRWAAVGWIQSFLRDPRERALVAHLEDLRRRLVQDFPDSAYPEEFAEIHQNLLRMWAEV